MANIKEINVIGYAPTHFVSEGSEILHRFLADTLVPGWGITFEWLHGRFSKPNEYGGTDLYFEFHIYGKEAVSWSYLNDSLHALLAVGGEIRSGVARDVTAETVWFEWAGNK